MPHIAPTIFKCEGGTGCSHVIPDDIYNELNSWCRQRGGDLFICHEDCVGDFVILKHEDVWCVVAEDPE